MSTGLSAINRALNRIPKRAEQRQSEHIRNTFVDSGIASAIETIDHQVIYGRRGTGKTHAFRYLEAEVLGRGELALFVDLRTIGSPDGLFLGEQATVTDRAGRLLVDLLSQVHEGLMAAALDNDALLTDAPFVARLDALLLAISSVKISGEMETENRHEKRDLWRTSATAGLDASAKPGIRFDIGAESSGDTNRVVRESRKGIERLSLNFGDIVRALRNLADCLSSTRVWLLLDEWSSVPPDIQPYLGEFLTRCVFPLQRFTVKIAAVEQQTNFRITSGRSSPLGIELGADVSANVNLDEVMVYEQDRERSHSFFRGLFFKHLSLGVDADDHIPGLRGEDDVVRLGFTDKRAFDELVRAAEGLPRDAINIAAKAAFRAGKGKVSVADVRIAARAWFQTDKEAALRSRAAAQRLLNWIIDNVIRVKRARAFLVSQQSADAPLLLALFDARVLHLYRRGYSAQDSPGERFDVWVIDYGAYVDLIATNYGPQGLLAAGSDDHPAGHVDVPTQDLRAIRRAVLNLDEFARTSPDPTP